MNMIETAQALGLAQAFDRRTVGEMDVRAWQLILADVPAADAMEAIRQHYAQETDWIMPAHVRRAVAEMGRKREVSPWAPGQYGVPREEAMPTELRPSAAEAGLEIKRLSLSDLPAEVAALVARVRADLPEGSREALNPRRAAWEREHKAYLRSHTGEPNPLYRPGAAAEPGTVACPLCSGLSQDLPAHMRDYHPSQYDPRPAALDDSDGFCEGGADCAHGHREM